MAPISKIVVLLTSARLVLDAPPTDKENAAKAKAAQDEFWKAFAALDIQPIQAALKKFHSTYEAKRRWK